MIGLIWAQAHGRVIGRDGVLPWHVPEDLAYFKNRTLGATVVMGRRTWDYLDPGQRPLPGRQNVVVTRDLSYRAAGARVLHDVSEIRELDGPVWIMGGGALYASTMAMADLLDVSYIDLTIEGGDAFAPVVGPEWAMAERIPIQGWKTSRTGIRYRTKRFERARIAGGHTPRPLALVN